MVKLFLLSTILIFSSCGKRSELVFDVPTDDRIGVEGAVDFETLKSKILIPHCIKCHKKMDQAEGLTKHITNNDPYSSRLFLSVKEGTMPKKAAPLSTEEIEIVRKYIENLKVTSRND